LFERNFALSGRHSSKSHQMLTEAQSCTGKINGKTIFQDFKRNEECQQFSIKVEQRQEKSDLSAAASVQNLLLL